MDMDMGENSKSDINMNVEMDVDMTVETISRSDDNEIIKNEVNNKVNKNVNSHLNNDSNSSNNNDLNNNLNKNIYLKMNSMTEEFQEEIFSAVSDSMEFGKDELERDGDCSSAVQMVGCGDCQDLVLDLGPGSINKSNELLMLCTDNTQENIVMETSSEEHSSVERSMELQSREEVQGSVSLQVPSSSSSSTLSPASSLSFSTSLTTSSSSSSSSSSFPSSSSTSLPSSLSPTLPSTSSSSSSISSSFPPTSSVGHSGVSGKTRSKAGAVSAAGVITSEMLSTVASDTPVVLTEVQGVKNVFCCIRPPGHHAGRFGSTRGCSNNGFCLLNNVAIGAYYARIKYGLRRFAVVDIDAHFGNGTAEIFEGDENAFYSSVHLQYDGPKDYFFPSSTCCLLGADEIHPNRVLVNIYPPVRPGNPLAKSGKPRSRDGFRTSFEDIIMPALRTFRPDIIFISAGFDGASTDPIGGQVGLNPIDFHWMADRIQVIADDLCGGRVVSVLEGGYDVSKVADGLATCAEAHVLALAGRPLR